MYALRINYNLKRAHGFSKLKGAGRARDENRIRKTPARRRHSPFARAQGRRLYSPNTPTRQHETPKYRQKKNRFIIKKKENGGGYADRRT